MTKTATKGATKPRQFRLTEEELAILDAIAAYKRAEDGVKRSRTDAIRMAARHYAITLSIPVK